MDYDDHEFEYEMDDTGKDWRDYGRGVTVRPRI